MSEVDNTYDYKKHYEIEKDLANLLKAASSREERLQLYPKVYDLMYSSVPNHPQTIINKSKSRIDKKVKDQMGFLRRFLTKDDVFLEIGCGQGHLSLEAAKYVQKVCALDVSKEITNEMTIPENFKLVVSNGLEIPFENETFSIIYSNQVMEHFHPEDAEFQLKQIYDKLIEGGKYICSTPNRLNGPHDVSKYYDDIATCFHLKEYTKKEILKLFKTVGFVNIKFYIGAYGIFINLPSNLLISFENLLEKIPAKLRKKLTGNYLLRPILTIKVSGCKAKVKNVDKCHCLN